jgi:hypothetical protein
MHESSASFHQSVQSMPARFHLNCEGISGGAFRTAVHELFDPFRSVWLFQ